MKNNTLTGRSSIRGKLIGRKKLRDSDLIRKLLKNGLSYRAIAAIAKTSHGSVHAEKVSMKREEEALRKKLAEEEKAQNAAIAEALATPPPIVEPAPVPAPTPA